MNYTYDKLIAGESFAYNMCAALAEKATDPETKRYYDSQCNLHQENIHRYIFARSLVGNEIVIQRRY